MNNLARAERLWKTRTFPHISNRLFERTRLLQMKFEGLWSSKTHPKDFPSSLWLTHFSDIIGATHDKNYSFWAEGQWATDGVRQLAEWGSTAILESELRQQVNGSAENDLFFYASNNYIRDIHTRARVRYFGFLNTDSAQFIVPCCRGTLNRSYPP